MRKTSPAILIAIDIAVILCCCLGTSLLWLAQTPGLVRRLLNRCEFFIEELFVAGGIVGTEVL